LIICLPSILKTRQSPGVLRILSSLFFFNTDHCNIPPQNRAAQPGRHLVPSSAMEPMHPFCTVQMICKYQDERFHVLRSGLKSAASSASYSFLHHMAVRDSTHRSPSGRHTKAIMTAASTCRTVDLSDISTYLDVANGRVIIIEISNLKMNRNKCNDSNIYRKIIV